MSNDIINQIANALESGTDNDLQQAFLLYDTSIKNVLLKHLEATHTSDGYSTLTVSFYNCMETILGLLPPIPQGDEEYILIQGEGSTTELSTTIDLTDTQSLTWLLSCMISDTWHSAIPLQLTFVDGGIIDEVEEVGSILQHNKTIYSDWRDISIDSDEYSYTHQVRAYESRSIGAKANRNDMAFQMDGKNVSSAYVLMYLRSLGIVWEQIPKMPVSNNQMLERLLEEAFPMIAFTDWTQV